MPPMTFEVIGSKRSQPEPVVIDTREPVSGLRFCLGAIAMLVLVSALFYGMSFATSDSSMPHSSMQMK
jgi:hypothetical protein